MGLRMILDSEAVSALAHPNSRGSARQRSRMISYVARDLEAAYVLPIAVLAEVYRGDRTDSGVDHFVNRTDTADLDEPTARMAGGLRTKTGKAGEISAIDAIVAATAVLGGESIIATGDPDDMRALASEHKHVKVWSLNDPPPQS